MRHALRVSALVLLGACAAPSDLLVVLDGERALLSEIDALELRVEGGDEVRVARGDPSFECLPMSFGIRLGSGGIGPIELEIAATRASGPAIVEQRSVALAAGETQQLRVHLGAGEPREASTTAVGAPPICADLTAALECARRGGCWAADAPGACGVPCPEPVAPSAVAPPLPVAPPRFTSSERCPLGWTEELRDEVRACAPWSAGRPSCAQHEMALPGQSCAPIGAACGSSLRDRGVEGAITRVNPATFEDAVRSAVDGAIIAMEAGVYVVSSSIALDRTIRLIGECVSQTRIELGIVGSFRATGANVELQDLSLVRPAQVGELPRALLLVDAGRTRVTGAELSVGLLAIAPGATLTIERSALTSARINTSGRLELDGVALYAASDANRINVQNGGGSIDARDVVIVGAPTATTAYAALTVERSAEPSRLERAVVLGFPGHALLTTATRVDASDVWLEGRRGTVGLTSAGGEVRLQRASIRGFSVGALAEPRRAGSGLVRVTDVEMRDVEQGLQVTTSSAIIHRAHITLSGASRPAISLHDAYAELSDISVTPSSTRAPAFEAVGDTDLRVARLSVRGPMYALVSGAPANIRLEDLSVSGPITGPVLEIDRGLWHVSRARFDLDESRLLMSGPIATTLEDVTLRGAAIHVGAGARLIGSRVRFDAPSAPFVVDRSAAAFLEDVTLTTPGLEPAAALISPEAALTLARFSIAGGLRPSLALSDRGISLLDGRFAQSEGPAIVYPVGARIDPANLVTRVLFEGEGAPIMRR